MYGVTIEMKLGNQKGLRGGEGREKRGKGLLRYGDVFTTLYVLVWKYRVYNEHKPHCCSLFFLRSLEGDLIRYTVISGNCFCWHSPFLLKSTFHINYLISTQFLLSEFFTMTLIASLKWVYSNYILKEVHTLHLIVPLFQNSKRLHAYLYYVHVCG